jgi:DNA-binding response OmpR family regulator
MKTRILLIEDDPALRKLLKEALPESIFIIDVAETGREGLDLVGKRKPDLVLLDWNLPDLNGFEVCKFIKQNKSMTLLLRLALADIHGQKRFLIVCPFHFSQWS